MFIRYWKTTRLLIAETEYTRIGVYYVYTYHYVEEDAERKNASPLTVNTSVAGIILEDKTTQVDTAAQAQE